MALGDIKIYDEGYNYPGDTEYAVQSGTTWAIKPGEPVALILGQPYVTALATTLPSSANQASTILGIATTYSTETAAADGKVKVQKCLPGMTYLMTADTIATYGYIVAAGTTPAHVTQATYDALVGKRVRMSLAGTAGNPGTEVYTILAADNAAYGCIVEPLDIAKAPWGSVRFSIRPAATSSGWATGIS